MSLQVDHLGPPQDWERHQACITRLYALHTLSDVMQIMRDKHQFTASLMMYKKHIRKWGVQKNLRHNHVVDVLCSSHDSRFSEMSSQYTGLVDPGRIQVHLYRLPGQRRDQIDTAVAAFGGFLTGHFTPLPNVVSFPITAPERYLYHIRDYVTGIYSSGAWSKIWLLNLSSNTKSFCPIHLALTAKNAFIHGYNKEAFRVINLTFDRLKSCIKLQTMDILNDVHWIGLCYYSFSREIAVSWVKYFIHLSRIIYTSGCHPRYQTAWIEQLGRIDIEDWIHLSVRAIEFNMHTLCSHLITDNTPNSGFVRGVTVLISRARGMGQPVVEPTDFASVGRLTSEGFGCTNLEDPFTKFTLAGVLFDEGKYGEAKQIAEKILESNQVQDCEVTGFCYRILSLIAKKTGHLDEAICWARQSLSFCATHLDAENELTIDALHDMQELLRSQGEVGEARDYQKWVSDRLNGKCDRL